MIINKTWQEGIEELEENSVSCIITDPPYKMHSRGATRRTGFDPVFSHVNKNLFKGGLPDYNELFEKIKRPLEPSGHVYLWSGIYDLTKIINALESQNWKLCNILVMHKTNVAVVNSYYMKTNEFVIMARRKDEPAKKISNCSTKDFFDVIQPTKSNCNKIHPTQKPISMIKTLIENSSEEGDLILDLFAGSGSTGIAAIKTNRRFIGFETDDEMCEKANSRLKECINNE